MSQMNEPEKICPKCKDAMTELQGGLWCCPACGFEGEPAKPQDPFERRDTRLGFWILLLLPSALALVSFVAFSVGNPNFDTVAFGFGMMALISGFFATIYCGIWLARRFFSSSASRFWFGLIFILGIGLVNFIIIFAGCAGPGLLRK